MSGHAVKLLRTASLTASAGGQELPGPFPRTSARPPARAYPLSRFYLRPLAAAAAICLAPTRVRPWQLTVCGLIAAVAAGLVLIWRREASLVAAGLVLLAWFFDRLDGQLARRQRTSTRLGAWLDANIDELVDIGWHLCLAAAASWNGSHIAGFFVIAFLAGKYLFMYGLWQEESQDDQSAAAAAASAHARHKGWVARLYHLPASADVRVHLFAAALATGWFVEELAFVAAYYNLRWTARYWLVAQRLREAHS